MTAQELEVKQKQEVAEKEDVRPGRYFQPDVDIFEDEARLRIHADMPGASADRISVELRDGVLTVQGEVDLGAYDGLAPLYTKYNFGHYLRRFRLPSQDVYDAEQVSARLDNGVLEVELPKSERSRPRRIEVQAG